MTQRKFYSIRLDPDGELDMEWIFDSIEELDIAADAMQKAGVDFEENREGISYARGGVVASFIRDVFGDEKGT